MLFIVLPRPSLAQGVVYLGVNAAAVLALFFGPAGRQPGWRLLKFAALVYFIANVPWYVIPGVLNRPLSFPSVVDYMFFASYALYAVALVAIDRALGRLDRVSSIDAIVIAIAVGCLQWEFLLQPVLGASDISASARVAGAGYPIAVTILFALGVRLGFSGRKSRPEIVLLLTWLGAELVADVVYGLTSAAGTFTYGQNWQALWLVSFSALGAAALHPRATAPQERVMSGAQGKLLRLVGLGAAVIVPLVLTIINVLRGQDGDALLMTAVAVGSMVFVLARLSVLIVDLGEQRRVRDELVQLSDELSHRADHDALTGAANRRRFEELLTAALERQDADARTAVLMLDMDNFKSINDTFGHASGDEMLGEVARRLRGLLREDDAVGRLGGDEFCLLLCDVDEAEAERTAQQVVSVLEEPISVGSHTIRAGASIGVAMSLPGMVPSDLLKRADIAMYSAKEAGRSTYRFYTEQLGAAIVDRHRLENELKVATKNDELVLHYQPVIEIASGRLVGVEALVRWQHPERGLLSPFHFIEIAEETGSIHELGRWTLEEAARQTLLWEEASGVRLEVAVNLSPVQLENPEIAAIVQDVLGDAGLEPHRVMLEVTEGALMRQPEEMIDRLAALKESGVRLAIDDFGTGYSSLSYLRRLPVDVLKVDRAFVSGIARESAEFALASAIVRLAQTLGKTTLAEGIELAEQLAHLRALKCQLGQGYFFAKPLPPDEITPLLTAERWPVATASST